MIRAEIIADSRNIVTGDRITSFVVVIPRIVLAEFNTHRMISRNSASSRAIPFEKMMERVKGKPFIPLGFQKDHKGMQGSEYLEGRDLELARVEWLNARNWAVTNAGILSKANVTKQLCNRILEPFMYHTIICTATEWENFMALRAHPAAEIHIAKAAELMLEAMNESTPKKLALGEWHIPFGDKMYDMRIHKILREGEFEGRIPGPGEAVHNPVPQGEYAKAFHNIKIKIATARCARVSYLNYEGEDDYEKDISLHDRLSSMGHWSPFEHCAQAVTGDQTIEFSGSSIVNGEKTFGWYGNFKGFEQYRKMFANENKKDERLL